MAELNSSALPLGLTPAGRRRLAIAIVCDFVYPRLGGVEMHIWSLSQCLVKMGHKVIVVTNMYNTNSGSRVGIRYMTNGLKVYYMPVVAMVDQATMPTYYSFFPLFRKILMRERIDIVHGHSATSPLMHECILQAKAMGYKCMFTDHSLFGFADAASINVNKYLKFTLSNIDHCICVSHTDRENLVLRAALDPRIVSTLPNAVDAQKFQPDATARPATNKINIVMLSRLVYRKGIDLVINVIPEICARFPNVHFIIGGDGPKKLLLEEMRERHQLHDRVELLGAVPHKNVRDVLIRGHIFLNCSLTEAFCIAILEAACCGCFCVSTRVGGVPEVLPHNMIKFAEPKPESIVEALVAAIPRIRYINPEEFHAELKDAYNWPDVAERTVTIYENVVNSPPVPLVERFRRYFGVGRLFGPLAVIIAVLLHFMWCCLEIVAPASEVDIVPDVPIHLIDSLETAESVKHHYATTARPGMTAAPLSVDPFSPPGMISSHFKLSNMPVELVPVIATAPSGRQLTAREVQPSNQSTPLSSPLSPPPQGTFSAELHRLRIRTRVPTASDGTIQATPSAADEDVSHTFAQEYQLSFPGMQLKTPLHRPGDELPRSTGKRSMG